MYLRRLNWLEMDPSWDVFFNQASKTMLFVSGISGVGVILFNVIKAYFLRNRIRTKLEATESPVSEGQT